MPWPTLQTRAAATRKAQSRAVMRRAGDRMFSDRVMVMRSVGSVRLFPLYLSNLLTFDLDFSTKCTGHGHSSPGIENQGDRDRSRPGLELAQ